MVHLQVIIVVYLQDLRIDGRALCVVGVAICGYITLYGVAGLWIALKKTDVRCEHSTGYFILPVLRYCGRGSAKSYAEAKAVDYPAFSRRQMSVH